MGDVPAFQWLTTAPNPRSSSQGYDAGQRGWKTHAVEAEATMTFAQVRFFSAACGVSPNHGWGQDLFIEQKCDRCIRALKKRFPDREFETPAEQVTRRLFYSGRRASRLRVKGRSHG